MQEKSQELNQTEKVLNKKKTSETLIAPVLKEENKVQEYLSSTSSGFYLPSNHVKMIWQGNKSLIVLSMNYKDVVGKRMYLVGGNECYGVINIKSSNPISLKEFEELSDKHRITSSEKDEWWPGKKLLYAYEFDFEKFDLLKRVSVPDGTETIMKDIQFLSEDPLQFNKLTDSLKNIDKTVVLENAISVVYSKDYMEVIVAIDTPSKFIKENLEKQLVDMLSSCYEGDVKFKWNSSFKGVPLFDLILEKKEKIEKKSIDISSLNSIEPMLAGKEFTDIDETLTYLFGGM